MKSINAVVIGLGSIGQRHARVLKELGHGVTTVSRRGDGDHTSIASAIAAARPGYAVIATETSQHAESLRQLAEADFRGSVLVEKPLFAHAAPAPDYPFASLVVGYNLRFHPVMTAFAERLGGRRRSRSRPMSDRISATGGRDATTARRRRQRGEREAAYYAISATNWIICYGCSVRGSVSPRSAAHPARERSMWTTISTSCSK